MQRWTPFVVAVRCPGHVFLSGELLLGQRQLGGLLIVFASNWRVVHLERSLGDGGPSPLRRWEGNGVVARVETTQMARTVSRLKRRDFPQESVTGATLGDCDPCRIPPEVLRVPLRVAPPPSRWHTSSRGAGLVHRRWHALANRLLKLREFAK